MNQLMVQIALFIVVTIYSSLQKTIKHQPTEGRNRKTEETASKEETYKC